MKTRFTSHAAAAMVAVIGVPALYAAVNLGSRLSRSIRSDAETDALWLALGYVFVTGGVSAAVALASASRDRTNRPIVAGWGPALGLLLLGIAALILLWFSAWTWGQSFDATPRQLLASDAFNTLPWVAVGSYAGALGFGMIAQRVAVEHRRTPLWGLLFLAPAWVSVATILLVSQNTP